MVPVRVRSLDPARYAETFTALVRRSTEYAPMLERLVALSRDSAEGYRFLDVGAGPGDVLRGWIERGGRRPGAYVAVEPNPLHAKPLRETIEGLGVAGEVIEKPFGPELPIPGRFDLILFSHSLYFMDDLVRCVRHAVDSLADGGAVICVLAGPLGMFTFVQLFEPSFDRDVPCLVAPTSSHTVMLALRDAGLSPEIEFDATGFDLTGLFDPGSDAERNEFVSFCLQIEFAELPEPLASDAVQYLRVACVEQGERLFWPQPTAVIRVGRPVRDSARR